VTERAEQQWVVLGRFGRVHGIKGSVSVISFTVPRENILDYKAWHVKKDNRWHPIQRTQDEVTDKHLLTKVEGFETREEVASLTNLEIGVPESMLPKLEVGEYYWHELIGMNVVHQNGTVFGRVHELIETGSNDVLIVQGDQRYLIPYLAGEVILSVDKEKKQITVNWDLDY
jgi:16S rRNA processing protein RimM